MHAAPPGPEAADASRRDTERPLPAQAFADWLQALEAAERAIAEWR